MDGENRRNQGGQQHLQPQEVPKEIRPLPNQQCPRCLSTDTKFSYFNNNKRSQPRYLCRSCRRLWTQGGILRNIPPRESPVRRTRSGAEVLRVAISSPPPCVGLSVGRGFKLATQNSSRPQQPAGQQLIFTRGNHLSLPGINYLNHFANHLLSQVQVQLQGQGQDPGEVQVHGPGQGEMQVQGQDQARGQVQVHGQGLDQVQDQDQGQLQSPPTNQLQQEPKPIEGIAALPNGVTWMHPPTSVTTTNYIPPLDNDADIYWDKNIRFNVGGSSSGSSSVDWLAQFRGFEP